MALFMNKDMVDLREYTKIRCANFLLSVVYLLGLYPPWSNPFPIFSTVHVSVSVTTKKFPFHYVKES